MPGYPILPSIRVKDVRNAVEFYTRTLGFELQRSQEISDNNSLKLGNAQVMIEGDGAFYSEGYNALIRERLGRPSANAFYIESDDLDALYERLRAAGVTVVDPLAARDWGQSEFTIEDPEGNWLTFWQAS